MVRYGYLMERGKEPGKTRLWALQSRLRYLLGGTFILHVTDSEVRVRTDIPSRHQGLR
jgi:hypothetical protein